jgi:hypothetical protein
LYLIVKLSSNISLYILARIYYGILLLLDLEWDLEIDVDVDLDLELARPLWKFNDLINDKNIMITKRYFNFILIFCFILIEYNKRIKD